MGDKSLAKAFQTDAPSIIDPEIDEEEVEIGEEEEEELEREVKVKTTTECWQRLYDLAPKTGKKVRAPLPELEDREIEKLKEQVRLLKGKCQLKKKRPAPTICWMDLPDQPPKTNRTAEGRQRYIRYKLEDRKDSEEDVFSSRCLL